MTRRSLTIRTQQGAQVRMEYSETDTRDFTTGIIATVTAFIVCMAVIFAVAHAAPRAIETLTQDERV